MMNYLRNDAKITKEETNDDDSEIETPTPLTGFTLQENERIKKNVARLLEKTMEMKNKNIKQTDSSSLGTNDNQEKKQKDK